MTSEDREMEWQRYAAQARAESRDRNAEHWRKEDRAIGQILAFCVGLAVLLTIVSQMVQP
jgi:hypothetical protein